MYRIEANPAEGFHPERVRAVAAGGLPILPVGWYDGRLLTFPVGIGDLERIAERPLQRDALRRTPMLLFQGGADGNDSVPEGRQLQDREAFGSDSYSYDQAAWINETLGRGTVERVGPVRLIYEAFGMDDFAYCAIPNTGHETDPIEDDVWVFFACVLQARVGCARAR